MQIPSIFINWPIGQKNHSLSQRYAQALEAEIEQAVHYFKQPIETLYIAAFRVSDSDFKWLLDTSGTLIKTVTFAQKAEISLEIGQRAVFEEQMSIWCHMGINRIVIRCDGDDRVQIEQLGTMVRMIARYIRNISLDVYTITPALINAVVALPITHISLYATEFFVQAKKAIQEAGFEMYEWQHYAKPGFESVHARNCWARKAYKGLGAGACSFENTIRTKNESDVARYSERMQTDQSAVVEHELLGPEEIYLETITTELRKPQGVSKKLLTHNSKQKMADFISRGFLKNYDHTIGYTDRGFLVENQILTQII